MLILDPSEHTEKQNSLVSRRQMTFGVCSGGQCAIVLVFDVLNCMMLVCVFVRFLVRFFDRDVQRTMQSNSRNHAAVARMALSSTSVAESEQINEKMCTLKEMLCFSCRCAERDLSDVMCRNCRKQTHIQNSFFIFLTFSCTSQQHAKLQESFWLQFYSGSNFWYSNQHNAAHFDYLLCCRTDWSSSKTHLK